MVKPVSGKYNYKVSKVNSKEWDSILELFPDASVYQTEAFSKYSIGGKNLEQFIMYDGSEPIAAALVRIKLVPVIKRGTAYIRWAPLVLFNNTEILKTCLEFLYREYVEKRNLLLRIMSNIADDVTSHDDLFRAVDFKRYAMGSESIIIDLGKSEEELRSDLRKKWRYSLKQAEKSELKVELDSTEDYFESFFVLYKEMHSRKKFDEYVDISLFRKINIELPDDKKMKILLCKINDKPVSGIVLSTIGKRGIYLLGGSSEEGLKVGASYFLQWHAIKWLKANGFETYDLGGIDKNGNPGVYTFKSGMGGKEINYLGGFEACRSITSKLAVKLGEFIR